MAARGYTSAQAVADELGGITLTAVQRIHLDRLMLEAEAWIDRKTGRAWLKGSPIEEMLIPDSDTVTLRHRPITTVTGIAVETNILAAPEAIEDTDSWRVLDASLGLLAIPGYGGRRIYVTYTHGGVPVPDEIARAARLMCAHWLRPKLDAVASNIKSYSVGSELSVTRFESSNPETQQGYVPDEACDLVDAFKRSWFS